MVFAPEDKRAWLNSEVMAELEKVARAERLLEGPPPEAFLPIQEKEASQDSWEEEDEPAAAEAGDPRKAALAGFGMRLVGEMDRMAHQLADAGRIKAAYRLERALAALKGITGGE
jgi:hypothetical protein